MHTKTDYLLLALAFILLALPLSAQQAFNLPLQSDVHEMEALHRHFYKKLPQPDWQKVAREDALQPNTRFSVPLAVDIDLNNAGEWTMLNDGGRIWRLGLKAEGALGQAVFFDELVMPPHATLHIYSADHRQLLGAYTAESVGLSNRFWMGIIEGDEVIVEYYEPAVDLGRGKLHIHRVDYVYNKEMYESQRTVESFGYGASLPCHSNAACDRGDELSNQRKSVCRIIVVVEEGMGYCSGTLMNNTSRDGTPYVLSAYHCQDGYTPIWDMYRFDFNYQSADCTDSGIEPRRSSVIGAQVLASRQQNDFILFQLLNPIPYVYDVYMSGWNVSGDAPSSSYIFHHPVGDIKKVAYSSNQAQVFGAALAWDNDFTSPPNHLYRVEYTEGSLQVGSSGAALFGADGLVYGQMHGGDGDCADPTIGYFDRLSYSWTGGGTAVESLSPHLDPIFTTADTLHGMPQPDGGAFYDISGNLVDEDGVAICGAALQVSNPAYGNFFVLADENGHYSMKLPANMTFNIFPFKQESFIQGVTSFDIIKIRKRILGINDLDNVYRMLAADVNNSGSISGLDIIKIQKVILAIEDDFGTSGQPAWSFVPSIYPFPDPNDPFVENVPLGVTITPTTNIPNVNFIGFKNGDANGSASPECGN